VPEADLWRVVDEVEEETFRGHDREVPTTFVGQLVAEKLRRLDQVAYVRFASVYKQFKTLEELVEEAKAVLDAKRFEDPTQGRLFIEATRAAAAAAGGVGEEQPGGNGAGRASPRPHRRGRTPSQSTAPNAPSPPTTAGSRRKPEELPAD
jgi:hypothetical protein